MQDIIFLVATVVCFAVAIIYVVGCDRMKAGNTNA
jgi:hypothetical protein